MCIMCRKQATFVPPLLIFPRYGIIKFALSRKRLSSVLNFPVVFKMERPHLGLDNSPVTMYPGNRG